MRSTTRHLSVAAAALCAALAAVPAAAQALGFANQSDEPIYIEAKDGIEWRRDESTYIARGSARASQAGTTVEADILSAYYRRNEAGDTEIYLLQAEGNVRITSKSETATGDAARFDVTSGVLVITGREVRLDTGEDVIIARDSLEYYQRRRLAVARGEARAIRGERRITADVLLAYFRAGEGETRASDVERIEAVGNVLIATPEDVVRARWADYDPIAGIATLTGDVKITRGDSQLNGEFAEVNFVTGISRLTAGAAEDGGKVKGLLLPVARPRQNPSR
ncbi:MAG: LptA/OstA family protein [Alphaproteobacteria bacterium]